MKQRVECLKQWLTTTEKTKKRNSNIVGRLESN